MVNTRGPVLGSESEMIENKLTGEGNKQCRQMSYSIKLNKILCRLISKTNKNPGKK